jgi:3-hydroxypropionyl-CoA synthetase (ADP-forming)
MVLIMVKNDEYKEFDKFFRPRSVAIIGASSVPGKIGYALLESMVNSEYEYKDKIFPVTLREKKIFGLKCYRSILDIPNHVDLAILIIPSKVIPKVIEECGEKGIRNVVIISGGFKELGGEFAEVEIKVKENAKKYGIRIIGPNCIGVFDGKTRFDTFFQPRNRMLRPKFGPLAFITQSGTFGCTILEAAAESPIGVSKFVSYGNRCDVDEADLIRYFHQDPSVKVIAIYVEGFDDGRKFVEAASEVSKDKPIVVFKAGRTEVGSKAAFSHTGYLAGSYEICVTALKQSGVIVVNSIEELFDVVKALVLQPTAKGRKVGMVTNGAGPCVTATDRCAELGLKVGTYSPHILKALKEKLPPYAFTTLIVDLTGSATTRDFQTAIELLLQDPNIDIVMPFIVFQDAPVGADIADVIPKLQSPVKPILCWASGGPYTRELIRKIEENGVPVYQSPDRMVASAYALFRFEENKKKKTLFKSENNS